jgi:DNA-binding LacI/PurR family transcriptional regulator
VTGRTQAAGADGASQSRPTIADVADAAGVSKTTVSFAFNHPDRLAPATASRVYEVAHSLGYRPNPVARMLAQRRTGAIGVLTPQVLPVTFENPYFATFSSGVAAAAQASGYGLQFISPIQGSLARAIHRATVDGVIVAGLAPRRAEVEQVRQVGLPTVAVDSAALPGLPSIQIDDEGGSRAAAEHVLGLGHRSVIVLAIEPPEGADSDPDAVALRRLAGYRAAFDAAGRSLPDTSVLAAPSTIGGGASAFRRAWEDGHRPTAVLAMSDALAIGVLRAARELDLSVPEDLSVVGWDDIELADYTDPRLTTIHQPIKWKGELAVEWLLTLIDDPTREMIGTRLATRLVVRSSTGPAPQDARHPKGGELG